MIKFEEHDNQLFRMLEEPVPLTPDAEMPCLVRLIQDGGRGNMFLRNDHINFCEHLGSHYASFEILGYPVEEGSAEWRNKQLQDGKPVHKEGDSEFYQVDGQNRIIGRIKESGEFNSTWNATTFMRDESDGWQLYKEHAPEPKPLLADAKVGDLCQRSNGRYTQFHSKHKLKNGSIAYYFTDASGSTDIDGNHCIHECGNNIVSCEPLATEGTVEWAGQMLKLGKMVKHENNIYPHSLDVDGKVYYCHEHRESQGLLQEWIIGRGAKTGWQIYKEPKPEPAKEPIADCDNCKHRCTKSNIGYCQMYEPKPEPEQKPSPSFKVEDWVEMEYKGTLYYRQVISVHENGIRVEFVGATPLLSFDGKNNIVSMRLVRKLKPSDVVLDFGNGVKGTVRSCEHDGGCVRVISGDRVIAHIMIDVLEQPIRELVESLLKAQEKNESNYQNVNRA